METNLPRKEVGYASALGSRFELGKIYLPILEDNRIDGSLTFSIEKFQSGHPNGFSNEAVYRILLERGKRNEILPLGERTFDRHKKLVSDFLVSAKADYEKLTGHEINEDNVKTLLFHIEAQLKMAGLLKTMYNMGLNDIRIIRIALDIHNGVIDTSILRTGRIEDELMDIINDSLSEQDDEDESMVDTNYGQSVDRETTDVKPNSNENEAQSPGFPGNIETHTRESLHPPPGEDKDPIVNRDNGYGNTLGAEVACFARKPGEQYVGISTDIKPSFAESSAILPKYFGSYEVHKSDPYNLPIKWEDNDVGNTYIKSIPYGVEKASQNLTSMQLGEHRVENVLPAMLEQTDSQILTIYTHRDDG